MNPALVLSAFLGGVVFVSCVTAVIQNEDRYDVLDRIFVGGLGTSMLLTTPALFFTTPFDAWSFNLSRAFLAGMCIKRYLIPVFIEWRGRQRQRIAIEQAMRRRGDNLHDKAQDWF